MHYSSEPDARISWGSLGLLGLSLAMESSAREALTRVFSSNATTMTITREHPSLRLSVLPGLYYVHKVQEVPSDVLRKIINEPQTLLSITRTAEEISIVGQCSSENEAEGEWRCIKIAGPMPFGEQQCHNCAHIGGLNKDDRAYGYPMRSS